MGGRGTQAKTEKEYEDYPDMHEIKNQHRTIMGKATLVQTQTHHTAHDGLIQTQQGHKGS